ncbi:MAG TPA: TonB family protein, partial [Gemmatimonadaceae bacterium]|nr:TonB family protein [Gemmatimonadaceae bacterium]
LFSLAAGSSKPPKLRTPAIEAGEHLEYALIMAPTTPIPSPPTRPSPPKIPVPPAAPSVEVPTDFLVPMLPIADTPLPALVDTIFPGMINGESTPHLATVGAASGPLTVGDVLPGITSSSAYDYDAEPLPENPKPIYPPRMLRAGREADFNAEFFVDTTGRVAKETITIPDTVDRDFADAVRKVLVRWRFRPAQEQGLAVGRSVRQRFVFVIAGPVA